MPKPICDFEKNEYFYIAGHSKADGSPVATKVRFLELNRFGHPVIRFSGTNCYAELTSIEGLFKAKEDAIQYATDNPL